MFLLGNEKKNFFNYPQYPLSSGALNKATFPVSSKLKCSTEDQKGRISLLKTDFIIKQMLHLDQLVHL